MGTLTKAFAYLRVSGLAQVSGDGFDRQMEAIHLYAGSHQLEIVQVFREEGVSGKNELVDRPALSELFSALSEDGVKTVLIEKLDRLARDVVIQETIVRDMLRNGFQLISAMEPDLCSTDPTRKFIRQIMGATAEYEREMIVLKLRGARQRMKAKTGRCEGKKPFGFYPEEQPALKCIQDWHAEGYSGEAIAIALNTQGFRTRSGADWIGSTVRRILQRDEEA